MRVPVVVFMRVLEAVNMQVPEVVYMPALEAGFILGLVEVCILDQVVVSTQARVEVCILGPVVGAILGRQVLMGTKGLGVPA